MYIRKLLTPIVSRIVRRTSSRSLLFISALRIRPVWVFSIGFDSWGCRAHSGACGGQALVGLSVGRSRGLRGRCTIATIYTKIRK